MLPIAYRGQPRYVQKSLESSNSMSGCPTLLSRHQLALQFRVSIVVSIRKGITLSAFFRRVAIRLPLRQCDYLVKKIKHISKYIVL